MEHAENVRMTKSTTLQLGNVSTSADLIKYGKPIAVLALLDTIELTECAPNAGGIKFMSLASKTVEINV